METQLQSAPVAKIVPPKVAPAAMVFTSDSESESVLRRSLASLGVQTPFFAGGGLKAAISELSHSPSPRLLIVDINGMEEPIAHIHELAEVCEPGTGVLVIGTRNDVALYRDLKNAGVSDYLLKPLIGSVVTPVCNTILTGIAEQPNGTTGRLVVTVGVRGGVGATTISTRLARYLADTKKRRVVFVDLDLQGGDAALQLDVQPHHALREALEHPERVDDLFLDRAVKQASDRLHILSSLEALDAAINFDENAVISLVKGLMKRYRYVFVDVPAARASSMPKFMHQAGLCLLVSDGSLTSARDVARWRSALGPNTAEHTTIHILNKATSHGALPPEEFERGAGQAPDVTVPYERDVGRSSVLGIAEIEKSHSFLRALTPAVEAITGEAAASEQSFFSRIFG